MDGSGMFGIDRTRFINGVSQHVHNAAECFLAYGHGNRRTCVVYRHTALQSVGTSHRNGTDYAVPQKLLHFQSQVGFNQF